MGKRFSKRLSRNKMEESAKPDPFSVYVPFESLTESTVRSIVSVIQSNESQNWDLSQRTLLIFLLAINKKLTELEVSEEEPNIQLKNVRQWLKYSNGQEIDWEKLQQKYDMIADMKCDGLARYYSSKTADPYFELTVNVPFHGVNQSREYMKKYRSEGYKKEELKLYWNAKQLEDLYSNEENKVPPHDPSDDDAVENLRKYPVSKRNHDCKITYVTNGIEKAVFDIPEGAQIIVLNFANEQSPGGGYLRNARAQEEVLLFNSDGYRALLDLKYGRMGGGYAIPEFGCAYVRNMRCVHPDSSDRIRLVDMLVSACYCLCGQELYDNPKDREQLKENNLAKFQAFMSAAVANTIGDGSNTYLLLGPIGTGAFGNDVGDIGEAFRDVLDTKMMNSNEPIRKAFGNIWFVSIDDWKNEEFKEILSIFDTEKKEDN